MFTSKKLIIVSLLFGVIQNSQASARDIDTIAGVHNALDKTIAKLNKQISYLDEADESLENQKNSKKEFFLDHSRKIRKLKNIHIELAQQIKRVAEGQDFSIDHVTQNIEQLNNIEQQLSQILPLIKGHASPEQTIKLTKTIEENLREIKYLKELAQELLSNKNLGKDLAAGYHRTNYIDIKIKKLEKQVQGLSFMLGLLIPLIATSFGVSLYNFFKTPSTN